MDNKRTLEIHDNNHIQYQQLPFDKNICPIIWAILPACAGSSSIFEIKVNASGAHASEMLMLQDGWLPQGHGPVLACCR